MYQSDPSSMLYVGVDGGGTRCRVRVRDAKGQLLAEAEGGPANIRLGLDLVWANIIVALDMALAKAGEDRSSWQRISLGLGLAGIVNADDVQQTINAAPHFARIAAATDAHAACLGAFDGYDGGILISGTGSAGYGWINQMAHSVGGWGFEVGDDGSAAALGREAIHSSLQAFDGLATATDFTRAVIARFGRPADIVHWVTTAKPHDFGVLAPLTMQYAEAGDAVAVGLVQKSANDLGRYIMQLHKIGCEKICLVGGMAKPLSPWLGPWAHSLLAQPQHDAAEGALLLAHGMANGITPHSVTA